MNKTIDISSSRKDPLLAKRDEIFSEGQKVSKDILTSVFGSDFERSDVLFEKLKHLSDVYHLVDNLINSDQNKTKDTPTPVFAVGTKFIYECFEYLTSMGKNEVFHYVTGMKINNIFTLDNMQKVKLKKQSLWGVETEEQSTAEAIINIDRFGHNLHATFHSHPKNIVNPSTTDLEDLKGLISGGHKVIGAVFTMDGFLKFYSLFPFEIIIYGKGVEKINENFYKLTETN